MLSALALLLTMVPALGVSTAVADTADTSWFADAKYGISAGVLNALQNNADAVPSGGAQTRWDTCVNEFDAELFALQAAQTGADYVLLTLQQADRYFCAPNKTYTNLIKKAGVDAADACATRDLPMELANALSRRGIKLMLYVTADGPWKDTEVFEQALGGEINEASHVPPVIVADNVGSEASANFKKNWLAVIEEFAARYGSMVAGWWVDGADGAKWSATELQNFADMLKTYNGSAVISFNAGSAELAPRYYVAADDFTAGESTYFDDYPEAKYLDSDNTPTDKGGAQWHILSYLHDIDGKGRGYAGYTAEEMKAYVEDVNEKGGVVTIDVSVGRSGAILSNELEVMKAVANLDDIKYEIIQDFETNAARKDSAHGKFLSGSAADETRCYNPDASRAQAPLSGTASFFSGLLATEWGADHVVGNAPKPYITNANGVFFRLKTSMDNSAALCVTTVGMNAATSGINDAAYDLTMNNSGIRYYDTDGDLVTTGMVVPAGFDGYVFVPANLSQKTLDGITIFWIDAWYNGYCAEGRWHSGHEWSTATIVGVDDIGYYCASSDEEYDTILADLLAADVEPETPSEITYEYEIVQDYEGANTNGAYWGHANLVNGGIGNSLMTDPATAQAPLSGLGSFATQHTAGGVGNSGADYLVADAATMQHSLSNPTGIFFRMKTSQTPNVTLYVSTCGAASTDVVWGGNNNAQFSLMNWSYNNNCLNARWYALDGTDKTVAGDGRVVPANFDGYVFIPCDLSSKSLEGLTVMYAQAWAIESPDYCSQWWTGSNENVISYDNVGFYTAATAEECIAIMNKVEGSYEPPKAEVAIDQFQGYETAEEQANAAAAGAMVQGGDGAGITNRYVTYGQISGTTSRELYFTAHNYGGDYLVMDAPASTLGKTSGIYVRIKTNSIKKMPFIILPTTEKAGALETWPNNYGPAATQYYNLKGELVSTSTYLMPAGFDGYAFIPCGDIAGKAVAAQLLPTWFTNAYAGSEMDGVTHCWEAGPDGAFPTLLFDNIGYYYTSGDDADCYREIIEMVESSNKLDVDVEFEWFQGYETAEQQANAAAVDAVVQAGDGAGITNRYVTNPKLSGTTSRELYFISYIYGGDYLVMDAPASAMETTTGIYVRIKTNGTSKIPFIILPTTEKNNKLETWPNNFGPVATKYYNLDGELVSESTYLMPAGFDGYAFIPCGDIAGKAVAVQLLPTWFTNAYAGSEMDGATHCWEAGPDGGFPALYFDDIGYYSTPYGSAAEYEALVEELQVSPEVEVGFPYEVIQDYETQAAKDNFDRGLYENGSATENAVTYGTETQQAPLNGESSMHSALYATGWGTDHAVSHATAPTIENVSGVFFRLRHNRSVSVPLCVTTAGVDTGVTGLHDAAYDLTNGNNDVRYYSVNGELVAIGKAVPANFDGYVFVPADLSSKTIDGITFNWIDAWYNASGAESRWHNGNDAATATVVSFDNIGYYAAPAEATDADYAAMIAAVQTEHKDFRDMCKEDMAIAMEARGFDGTDSLSAKLLADFKAAVEAAADSTETTAIFKSYRADMAALANTLRLNVGGGQIREDDNALRFIMEVDQDFLAYMQKTYTNVEFGTLLARQDLYGGDMVCSTVKNGFSKNGATTIKRESAFVPENYTAHNGGKTLVHTCVIRNVPETNYDTVLRARNYMKYTDGDTEYIVYGEEINTTYQTIKTMSSDASTNTVSPFDQVSESVYLVDPDNPGLRVMFVGNSITRHGPLEDIGWSGDWGMAASSADKDYVHVSMNRIKETHPDAAFALCSVSSWEASYRTADETLLQTFAAARRFDADIIVLRLAENCDNSKFTSEDKALFVSQLEKLVNYLNADGEAGVLVTTGFWDSQVDAGLIEYADKYDCPLVDLNDLGYQDQYKAIGEYWHSGVCSHPNDAGMAEIAKRICDAMEQMPEFQVPVEE